MDNIKDNSADAENKLPANTSKNLDFLLFLNEDSRFIFIYKKTEKLASAIYLVTNHFSESEPMKWELRKSVSSLLSLMIDSKNLGGSKSYLLEDLKNRILGIVSHLQIASQGGLISTMNSSILKQEFFTLTENLNAYNLNTKENSSIFSKNFFDVKDVGSIQREHISQTRTHSEVIKDKIILKDSNNLKRSNRQNTILDLLKKKGELTIKDISQVIKDCSEKTLQRELTSFISIGVVRRTGERRWSRYSLAS